MFAVIQDSIKIRKYFHKPAENDIRYNRENSKLFPIFMDFPPN